MMRGNENFSAIRRHGRGDQTIARGAGRLLDAGRGLGPLPAQHPGGEPKPLCGIGDIGGLGRRLRPQRMIDGIDHEAGMRPMPIGERRCQQQQRQAVGPAGNGEPKASEFGQRSEDRLAVDHVTGHFAFCASSARRCVNAGLSCG